MQPRSLADMTFDSYWLKFCKRNPATLTARQLLITPAKFEAAMRQAFERGTEYQRSRVARELEELEADEAVADSDGILGNLNDLFGGIFGGK